MKKVLYKISVTEKNRENQEKKWWIRNNEELTYCYNELHSRFTLEEMEVFFHCVERNILIGHFLRNDLEIQVFPFVE